MSSLRTCTHTSWLAVSRSTRSDGHIGPGAVGEDLGHDASLSSAMTGVRACRSRGAGAPREGARALEDARRTRPAPGLERCSSPRPIRPRWREAPRPLLGGVHCSGSTWAVHDDGTVTEMVSVASSRVRSVVVTCPSPQPAPIPSVSASTPATSHGQRRRRPSIVGTGGRSCESASAVSSGLRPAWVSSGSSGLQAGRGLLQRLAQGLGQGSGEVRDLVETVVPVLRQCPKDDGLRRVVADPHRGWLRRVRRGGQGRVVEGLSAGEEEVGQCGQGELVGAGVERLTARPAPERRTSVSRRSW